MLWLLKLQLNSKNAETRRRAAEQIGASRDPRSVGCLVDAMRDTDGEVRRLVVNALGKLDSAGRVEPLLAALDDPDPQVQQAAIIALKRVDEDRVTAALVPLIRHADAGVRSRAAQALETLGWNPAMRDEQIWTCVARGKFARAAEFGSAALPALESVLDSDYWDLQVAAVEALGLIKDARIEIPLLKALKSGDVAVCIVAIDGLSRIGGARVFEAIVGALHHTDGHVRVAAVESLGRLGYAQAVEPLRPLLSDQVWDVRRAAAEALGRLKDSKSVEVLARTLSDTDSDVRQAGASALGNMKDRRAIGPLVKSLHDSTNDVRRTAAAALSRIDVDWGSTAEARAAVDELKSAVQEKEARVRRLISRPLLNVEANSKLSGADDSSINSSEKDRRLAAGFFIATLCDVDRDLRQAAAESLGRLGDKRAKTALGQAARDADADVRRAVERALELLGVEQAVA